MPLFDFYCPKCKKEEERLVTYSNMDKQFCICDPEFPMQKIDKLSANAIQFKGKWFKTSGSY